MPISNTNRILRSFFAIILITKIILHKHRLNVRNNLPIDNRKQFIFVYYLLLNEDKIIPNKTCHSQA